ncbi:ATP-binding protein [Aliiglaciecola sp.]|nr:ATP-binding protein [Aliiglaciecola sp.]
MDFSGSAAITDNGIKKHFKNIDPWKAIFELAWNGLDANATKVSVNIATNEMEGTEAVDVFDNGDGIDFWNIKDNFAKFNDSSKSDVDQHGSHGRGRLSFFRIAENATWFTKHNGENARIKICASAIKKFDGTSIDDSLQHAALVKESKGTIVLLNNCETNLPPTENLMPKFTTEFGWYLALNSRKSLLLNGNQVPVPKHDLHEFTVSIDDHNFSLKIIRWHEKPTSEKSYYYLLSCDSKILHKKLSSFNNKGDFWVSVYVESTWNDDFVEEQPDMFNTDKNTCESPTYKNLVSQIQSLVQNVYDEFLRRFAEEQIDKFEEEGVFPNYQHETKEYADWRLNNTKRLVTEIYIADPQVFKKLNLKQKKIIVRLLDKITVSDHNDSLFEVLNEVLDLEPEEMMTFAEQIKKSQLEHIINTIEVLHRREASVHCIREVMRNHYKDVLETPDLQLVIENNTWLFGAKYETLGAEENDFQSIAKNLRDTLPKINDVNEEDLEDASQIDGVRKQVDLFLARKVPRVNSLGKRCFHCVVVEIKRPGIALNKRHLEQLQEYADILTVHPEFSSQHMTIDLVLVGRKISGQDARIPRELKTSADKGEPGLVSDDGRVKCFVKTWETILDEFDLANDYLLSNLNSKKQDLSGYSTSELVKKLQRPSH